jgi:hypothetical protein
MLALQNVQVVLGTTNHQEKTAPIVGIICEKKKFGTKRVEGVSYKKTRPNYKNLKMRYPCRWKGYCARRCVHVSKTCSKRSSHPPFASFVIQSRFNASSFACRLAIACCATALRSSFSRAIGGRLCLAQRPTSLPIRLPPRSGRCP